MVAAHVPVCRRDQAPGKLAHGYAVARGRLRGERQAAIGALPAGRLGKRAFVRRRERVGIAIVALRKCQP